MNIKAHVIKIEIAIPSKVTLNFLCPCRKLLDTILSWLVFIVVQLLEENPSKQEQGQKNHSLYSHPPAYLLHRPPDSFLKAQQQKF